MAKNPVKELPLLDVLADSLRHDLEIVSADSYQGTLTDKMKIYDRVLKLEQVRLKIDDDDETSGFGDDD